MKTTNKILLAALIIILIAVTVTMAVFRSAITRDLVIGSGNVITRQVDVPAFSAIDVSGRMNMTLSQTQDHSLSIEADDNLMELIIAEVENNTLKVYLKETIGRYKTLNIEVSLMELESLTASGGARVTSETPLRGEILSHILKAGAISDLNLYFDEIALELMAGASATLSGQVRKMVASSLAGSELKAYELETEDCVITTTAGSRNEVYATNSLKVNASAGSVVNYTGDPLMTEFNSSTGARISAR